MKVRAIVLILTFVSVASLAVAADDAVRMRVSEAYGKLPLSFEANRGQSDRRVKFLSRGANNSLFLTRSEAVIVLQEGKDSRSMLRMKFVGANRDPQITGEDELPGKANYFIGNDRAQWRTNVPTYAKVRYRNLYPGIDLLYYGNERQLEYDFVVRPGADPTRVTLQFQGAEKIEIDAHGDLVLHMPGGAISQRKPIIYQDVDGRRVEIPGGYVLKDGQRIAFQVEAYDKNRSLVIDPVLVYSTYLGGINNDMGSGIAVDSQGNAYVTGRTGSTNFPTTTGAFKTTSGGHFDAFVTKLNATGTALLYSTFLGGTVDDGGLSIAVDTLGNAFVTGFTDSTNFPTTAGAFQTAFNGGDSDAFVTKLNPTGSDLLYSTYLGGSGPDEGFGIAVDSLGNAYVTGFTNSTNFPTTLGAFQTAVVGGGDAFVTKLNPTGGSPLLYSTYLGGNSQDEGSGIAVDSQGNAYVTGFTISPNFPTTIGAFQTTFGGGGNFDAFVTKLNATGSALFYSTYLGGTGEDEGFSIAVDTLGNAYVTGGTGSTNFPTTAGAFQTTLGGFDAFVTKLNSTGTALVYSTYLGGSLFDVGRGIAVDSQGDAYVTGATGSANFPTSGAFQTTFGGGGDAFVTKLNSTGSALVYSTYLGGSLDDQGFGIAVDTVGNAYVTGGTNSTDFPTTPGAFQTAFGGGVGGFELGDAFVAKIAAPAEALSNLGNIISGFGLPAGTANSLLAKVNAALTSLAAGNTTDACNELAALINEASAQSGKKLTAAEAAAIIAAAQAIRTALGCP